MAGDDEAPPSIRAALLADLNDALPAIAAMVIVLAAFAALDGWPVAVVVGCAVIGMFVGFAYRDRSSGGLARRRSRERFDATLDTTESKARGASRLAPVIAAFIVAAISGFDPVVFAVASLATFFVSEAVFGVWLHARHSARASRA